MAFANQHFQFLCLALVLILGLCATQALARPLDHHKALSLRERHELWMARHGRVYKDEIEKEKRFNIFKKNVERIENFNANASSNKLYTLGTNAFSDLTTEEFVATHTGYKKRSDSTFGGSVTTRFRYENLTDADIASSMDWRDYGAVTGIKDQGSCGTNAFSDLTTEEFVATHTGYKKQFNSTSNGSITNGFRYENLTSDNIPSSMDWREHGAVTGIKNQGQCGCCWAFSAVGAVEGLNQIKTGQLISLSEEELVDCVQEDSCGGGNMADAFEFIEKNQGISTEAEYPYTAINGNQNQCQATTSVVTINGYESIPPKDEAALLKAVSQQPISVGIDGGGFEFNNYQSGVFQGECGDDIDHAVTAIGYGTTTDGTDYWLLKNSWGESWGENGYMRLIRGQNKCGITLEASYPV